MQDPALCFLGVYSSVREKGNRKATWLFYYFYHYHHCYSRFLSSLVWFYLTLNEQMFTTTIVFLYMRKTSEMEVKYIELANKFIWVFLLHPMGKPNELIRQPIVHYFLNLFFCCAIWLVFIAAAMKTWNPNY